MFLDLVDDLLFNPSDINISLDYDDFIRNYNTDDEVLAFTAFVNN